MQSKPGRAIAGIRNRKVLTVQSNEGINISTGRYGDRTNEKRSHLSQTDAPYYLTSRIPYADFMNGWAA
jgi:hypothetical protein